MGYPTSYCGGTLIGSLKLKWASTLMGFVGLSVPTNRTPIHGQNSGA